MTRTIRQRRATGPAAVLTGLALTVAALAPLAATPHAAAAPVEDCATAFPVSDLAPGDALHGLTVTSGTTPTPFAAKVVGVLTDGIAPGVPMVIVKVDPAGFGAEIDPTEVKGIWQGMSGSPLYAADDSLVGAVSYGLSSQQSWVAGVTPFEDMTSYLGTMSSTVHLGARLAQRVAAAARVSPATASAGLQQLPLPLGVAGVPARFLRPTASQRRHHRWLATGTNTRLGVAAASVAPTADSIVAGGNVAASVSYGDVTMAGVGTATSVCDGQTVGFGHPFNLYGATTLALHPAEALYVQGDAPSFKVASIGAPVGTVFGDHLTGITGAFGPAPTAATVTATASDGSAHRTGTTSVSVRTPDTLAMSAFASVVANDVRVLDRQGPGSRQMTWRVTGHDARGAAYDLSWSDRYLAPYELSTETGFTLGDVVYRIASMPGVSVDSVTSTADASTSLLSYRMVRVEQRVAGAWTKVTMRKPVLARAGRPLTVRAVLRSSAGELVVPFTFDVPAKAAGRMAMLAMTGGGSTRLELGDSIGSARRALAKAVRSDVVRAQLGRSVDLGDGLDIGLDGGLGDGSSSEVFRGRGGPRLVGFTRTKTSAPGSSVVVGSVGALVVVR